jgi:hypothetical protein
VLRSRQRGQSVIEFGIIAILFTLIMFAIVDFGLLLNDYLSVSSGARLLARDAAVGLYTCGGNSTSTCPAGYTPEVFTEAGNLSVPGVSADSYFGYSFCCNMASSSSPGSALQVNVIYWNECTPPSPIDLTVCQKVNPATLDNRYSSDGVKGTCDNWDPSLHGAAARPCIHPAAPAAPGSPGPPPVSCGKALCPGDSVTVTLTAAGAQVITPLVRPFFSGPNCSGAAACYVPLSSAVTMRFEGQH